MNIKRSLLFLTCVSLFTVPTQAQDIMEAAKAGDLAKVMRLAEADSRLVHSRDNDGRTSLHWAARGVHFDTLRYLVEKDADVNAKRRLLGELCRSALRALSRYFELVAGSALTPGVIAAIQTFGDRMNFHPHLHFLVTEGGVDRAGVFHKIPRIDDSRLEEIFAREVLADLVRKELLSPEWAERILSWQHTGFSLHSLVRATTKVEAERVGKYMIRPLLSLERLSLDEREGKVGYRHGEDGAKQERMDYLEFIARVTSHIPDKGQVMVRYYGLYANAHRGKVRKASLTAFPLRIVEDELRRVPSRGWAAMIRKVYEVDPMTCPRCRGQMKVISFLIDYAVVDRIIDHLKLTLVAERPPPPQVAYQELLLAADPPAEYFT
jgi:hypothetical protein